MTLITINKTSNGYNAVITTESKKPSTAKIVNNYFERLMKRESIETLTSSIK